MGGRQQQRSAHLASPEVWHRQRQGAGVGTDAEAGLVPLRCLTRQAVGDAVVCMAVEGGQSAVLACACTAHYSVPVAGRALPGMSLLAGLDAH